MKDIEIGPIRPPSESNSLLIRVTRGCHWNKCYFCGLYKSMQFSMRPIDETIEDIRQQAQFYQGKKINSCFLQDGDALVLKTDYLLRILDAINQYFPDIQYITSYARADSITRKTPAELKILRQAGLNHLYCGMETGSAQILRLINKGFDSDTVVRSGCMAKDADMILSEFILLGIGGKELSEENAIQTAKALNVIQPDFIRVHATGIKPESKLGEFVRDGSFTLQSEEEIVIEQKMFLQQLQAMDSYYVNEHIYVWEKVKDYLTKAGTTIFVASILMWVILNFGPQGYTTEMADSFGAILGHWLVPFFAPIGLGFWQIAVALIAGISAKEVVVSSCAVLFGVPNINSGAGMDTLVGILSASGFGQLNAFCLMVFCLLYIPCAAALATIRKESGSTRWMLLSALFQLVVAWVVTFIVYRIGLFI